MFGKSGSAYDFAANDMNQMREKARELEEQQKGMKKKVNPKVLHTIDRSVRSSSSCRLWHGLTRVGAVCGSVEKREAALKKMMSTVLKDKEKIEETIAQLDQYKKDALQKTWEKVNGCVCRVALSVPVMNKS